MRHLILLFALILVLAGGCNAMKLTIEGTSDYQIVLPAQASPSERHAALELQSYLEQASGARLPLVDDTAPLKGHEILLGNNAHLKALGLVINWDKLGKEGFTIKTRGGRLIIAGGAQRGTMYGVYTFLENYLGFRWFTSKITRVPHLPTISLPAHLDDTQVPILEYREPFFTEAFDADWAARNKVNGQSMRLDEERGGKITYFPFVHTFATLVPPEKYFKDHPEYFSLVDGQRQDGYAQLCLTNPDVRRIALEGVRQWMKEHPEAGIYSVSQNDTFRNCQCDNCRALDEAQGTPMGSLLDFVNYIAGELADEFPDKAIDTLAYQYTRKAPKDTRPLPNVIIRLCSIECCFSHPLATCDSSENTNFRRDMEDWARVSDRTYIWDYNTDFANYWLPFPNYWVLQPNIKYFVEHGVKGIFEEGAYPPGGGGEGAELKSYIMAKALWDPDYDADVAINEFCEGVYGAAAPLMLEYLHMMADSVKDYHMHIWEGTNAPYLTPELITKADALFKQMLKVTERDELAHAEVEKAWVPILYVRCAQMGKGHPDFLPLAKQLFAIVDANGFGQWREGNPTENLRNDWLGQ